ncbi:ABC transporter ATP-binding protein [Aurantibacter aestuarii]|uniref:Antibiotic ABC transporter ATP-binding protein n=1 Tax=Aurantibacter aestuarii TaxID=1266046 RepID=A0A2T1N5C7_9FLAO|nr:ABC transporter ATP-binding protein [Aurantibacter aestuarii]PSG86464.1 antibiotic ABC transporter ATP-binding protein [Aurantibacter aestuarii]
MKRIFNQLLPYIKKYKKYVLGNIGFNVLYAFFSTLSFVALIPMMNVLFDKSEVVKAEPVWTGLGDTKNYLEQLLNYKITTFINSGDQQLALLLVVSIVIITFLFKNLFGYLALHHMMHLKNGVLTDLRKDMFEKIISLPLKFYSKRQKGDVMARVLGDVSEVQNSFFVVLELAVKEPLTILFSIIMMFAFSWELTLFVFIFIPIAGFIISLIGKSLKNKSLKAQAESGRLISIVEEGLTGLKVIKSYNSENHFRNKFNVSANSLLKLSNKIGKKNNLAGPLSEFMGIITIAILLWYGGNLVLVDKTLEGTVFLAFMGLAYNILTPAKAISKASYRVKNGLAAADRVFEILDEVNTIPDIENPTELAGLQQEISIEHINFKYNDDYVLKDFSVTIPKGKTVALVGQSGSGKSTIANLLTRFYDVNEGEIKFDGHNIKNVSIKSLRKQIGLVTQDSILFNDSIKNNLILGKEDATDEDVIDALKIANAWEFVKDLPQGIDTNIGDAGGSLSGGQKQRLSIARAVLKNPPIMVLDEATSALDTESERLVQEALENMMKNRTSVVIAHRLSTIQNADTIIVMHKGEIAEKGSHLELLAKNGIYKKLVDMQSFE